MFPDAPTERGAKHAMEMVKAVKKRLYGCNPLSNTNERAKNI